MKRTLSLALCALLLLSMVPFSTFAAEPIDAGTATLRLVSTEVEYLEDGSSIVMELYDVCFATADGVSIQSSGTVSKAKRAVKTDALGNELYDLYVYGTFTFNGIFARATSATYTHHIYANLYTLGSASTSCTDNYASATGYFYDTLGNYHSTLKPVLTCDADGNVY